MKKNPLVEVLEKIFWAFTPSERAGILIYIIHRGVPGDMKVIPIEDVIEYKHGYLHIMRGDEEYDEIRGFSPDEPTVPVPLHRVLKIEDGNGNLLYEKRSKNED